MMTLAGQNYTLISFAHRQYLKQFPDSNYTAVVDTVPSQNLAENFVDMVDRVAPEPVT